MRAGLDQLRYARGSTVVWRDTGAQILALPLGGDGEVVVLGGGCAEIWRLLSSRLTIEEIMEGFGSRADDLPREEIAAAVQSLLERGLLAADEAH